MMIFRRAVGRLFPGARVLMYHRISEAGPDPWGLSVSARHFAEHLEVLSSSARPLRLRKLAASLRSGEVPGRAVAVTFDDGYSDNLHQAKPLLERYQIPATVFVITGERERGREFWWDWLERVALGSGERYRKWRAWEQNGLDDRQRLYLSLHSRLRLLPPDQLRREVEKLLDLSAAAPGSGTVHRSLSTEELQQLAHGGLVEMGAHTESHPVLAPLPAETQRQEIAGSRSSLGRLFGEPAATFAYPYGGPRDHSTVTAALVREAGFGCAVSTIPGRITRRSDPYRLPRLHVEDWDGDEFAKRLWYR